MSSHSHALESSKFHSHITHIFHRRLYYPPPLYVVAGSIIYSYLNLILYGYSNYSRVYIDYPLSQPYSTYLGLTEVSYRSTVRDTLLIIPDYHGKWKKTSI